MSQKEPFFKAPGAHVLGNVTFGEDCAVWYNAVIRADNMPVVVGDKTNIQDNVTIHMDETTTVTIGSGVTIGHNAVLHGCTIGDNCLIGMGAIVLDHVKVGNNAMVGAGALVPPGMEIPEGMLAVGAPAKIRRPLTPEEIQKHKESADHYLHLAQLAKQGIESV